MPQTAKIVNFNNMSLFQKFIFNFLLLVNKETINNPNDLIIHTIPITSNELELSPIDFGYNYFIPTLFSLSYIAILFQFVLWIVTEKEAKLDEFVYRQGISKSEYFLSWIYTFILLMIIPILINTFLLAFFLFPKTSIIIIFSNMFLFSINIKALALVFNQLVSSLRSGQAILKLFFIGISILGIPATKETTHGAVRLLFCIFPQTILKLSYEILMETKVNIFILIY